jgi:KEOPS complex subunit Cgi121
MTTTDSSCGIRAALFDVPDPGRFLHSLRTIASDNSTTIICFNADNMAGRRHAEAALRFALRSWKNGTAISNSLEMEALLYASGSRQCTIASSFGIHKGRNRAYVCACPASGEIWDALGLLVRFVDGDWEGFDGKKKARLKELFSISDDEIAVTGESRLTDLILERVALLEVYR